MKFGQLKDLFLQQAKELSASEDNADRFRAPNYVKVANLIEKTFKETEEVSDAKLEKLEISDRMKYHLNTLVKTGKIKKIKKVAKPDSLVKELTEFMGIGTERAKQLVKDGLTNINQLHQKRWMKMLTDETKLFLEMKPMDKIPHNDIKELEPILNKLNDVDDCKVQLVGSYRRKKPFSSDIDLMLISHKENIIEQVLDALKDLFNQQAYPYSKGKDKMSIIIKYKNKVYKIDTFRVEPGDYVPSLLYTTGSKEFNIQMRGKAKQLGYLLNQKGLFKDGKKIEGLNTERDYFDILNMKYLEPHERF
jgi:DNA polymerase (family X)